jgi:nucleoside-triphosphatase THEP1
MSTRPKNIILQGRPGAGKTTVVERIVSRLPEGAAGGFFTREIREGGVRVGFRIVDLQGGHGLLGHVNVRGMQRVGKYGVDVASFERIGVGAVERALMFGQIVVIDEIGRMELFSRKFQTVVIEAFGSSNSVLATMMEGHHAFAERVRKREDVVVLDVTPATRAVLPGRVLRTLGHGLPADTTGPD